MKIELSKINKDDFYIKEGIVSGEIVYLIYPKVNPNWLKDNLIFRSSMWNKDGKLISAGFPKFSNLGEKPDVFGTIKSLNGTTIVEKLDGSLLSVSKYNGEMIIRTRGTFDATKLPNGQEIDILKNKYPKVFSHGSYTWNYSLLFEWLSPSNRIVIKHDVVDMKLIGGIYHENYSMMSQTELDNFSDKLNVPRPQYFKFNSLDDLINNVKNFKNLEGVCIVTNDGKIYKVKGDEYLIKHRLKEKLASFDKLLDYYVLHKLVSPEEIYKIIEQEIDWETAEETKNDIYKIYNAYNDINKILLDIEKFVEPLKSLTPKESADLINDKYKNTGFSSVAFNLLRNKKITEDDKIKLLYKLFNNKLKDFVLEKYTLKTMGKIFNILNDL